MTDDEVRRATSDYLRFHLECEKTLSDEADIFRVCGVDGVDAAEFIDWFATTFHVDMSGYLWYFHHGQEGFDPIGGLARGPYPGRIPISMQTLIEAAQTRVWPIRYPDHRVPNFKMQRRVNVGCTLVSLIGIAALAWISFAHR